MILLPEQQVTSPVLSADLVEAGINRAGLFEWRKYSLKGAPVLIARPPEGMDLAMLSGHIEWAVCAYTVSELATLIPRKANLPQATTLGRWYRMAELNIHRNEQSQAWTVAFIQPNSRQVFKSFTDPSMAEAMGEMLAFRRSPKL